MDKDFEEATLLGRMAPPAKSLKIKSEKFYTIADKCKIEVLCKEDGADTLVVKLAKAYWSVDAKVTQKDETKITSDEGYSIKVSASKLVISAKTVQGVRYAMQSLRQLAESERGVLTSVGRFILPCMDIEDEPDMPFRGMHICYFPDPESTYIEIEKQIRMAAYYKFNYVVIELWGTLRYPSHPEYCWDEKAIEAGELKRLVRIAKELGVTAVPQLNIFGHASAARCITGKHALLERHPEYAPLFEPSGWCWCLSNPETRKYLTDLTNDLLDIFDNPPFFHFGCDEAVGANSCALCRRADYVALLKDHLSYFGELVRARGARPMLWHDMFIERDDERWSGYYANGTKETAAVLKALPKDFVMCDWHYSLTQEEAEKGQAGMPTVRYFMELGLDVVVSPWYDTRNTIELGKGVKRISGFGLLETLWHRKHGNFFYQEYFFAALAAWNPESEAINAKGATCLESFDAHIQAVNRDMGLTEYTDLGSSPYQMEGPYYTAH